MNVVSQALSGFTWRTLNAATGRIETVEAYPTLDDAIADMAVLAWEDPGNHWLDYVVNEATGEVAATGLFGPGLELLITIADGRRMGFEMPEGYQEPA